MDILRMIYHCVHQCSPFNSCNITPVQTICSQQYGLSLRQANSPGGSRDIEPEGHAVSIGSSSLCLSKVPDFGLMDTAESPATQQKSSSFDHLWSTLGDFFEHILKSPKPNINTYQNHQLSRFIFLGAQAISWWHAEGNDHTAPLPQCHPSSCPADLQVLQRMGPSSRVSG